MAFRNLGIEDELRVIDFPTLLATVCSPNAPVKILESRSIQPVTEGLGGRTRGEEEKVGGPAQNLQVLSLERGGTCETKYCMRLYGCVELRNRHSQRRRSAMEDRLQLFQKERQADDSLNNGKRTTLIRHRRYLFQKIVKGCDAQCALAQCLHSSLG